MRKMRVILPFVMILVFAGCHFIPTGITVSPPPTIYLFVDDFSDDELGGIPSKWEPSVHVADYGTVEVIKDDGVPSGRAIHFVAGKHEGDTRQLRLVTPEFGEEAEHAKVVAFEYWLKWVEGTAVYNYISKGSTHVTNLQPHGNVLRTRHAGTSPKVTDLQEGWNRIRILADIERSMMTIYVNDMDEPADDDHHFLNPIDSWNGGKVTLTHETRSTEKREAYYADFKIWIVE